MGVHVHMCMCACVRACVHACVCACVDANRLYVVLINGCCHWEWWWVWSVSGAYFSISDTHLEELTILDGSPASIMTGRTLTLRFRITVTYSEERIESLYVRMGVGLVSDHHHSQVEHHLTLQGTVVVVLSNPFTTYHTPPIRHNKLYMTNTHTGHNKNVRTASFFPDETA